MKYAREHIKRYWVFEYRRALGVSLITFAIALAVGIVFTVLMSNMALPNPIDNMMFWALLVIFTSLVLVSSFANAHILSVKYMNIEEHIQHTKYVGGWLTILVLGAIAFMLPIIFFNNIYEPIMLTFGFGGIFWVLYLSVRFLFKYSYYEIAIGGTALWAVALLSALSVMATNASSAAASSFTLFISIISLIIVTGFIGMSLMVNASNEFAHEFKIINKTLQEPHKNQARRHR